MAARVENAEAFRIHEQEGFRELISKMWNSYVAAVTFRIYTDKYFACVPKWKSKINGIFVEEYIKLHVLQEI